MKVIILSAGHGKRLYPHTLNCPKCLVAVAEGCTLLGWQLRQLAQAGVTDVVVVTGFGADQVEAEIRTPVPPLSVRTLYNPGYATADNLASAALAATEMNEEFVILNGDTLFTAGLAKGLCRAPSAPVTMAVAPKQGFDDDDMKAIVSEGRLLAVAKTLDGKLCNAESIGMIRFQGEGVAQFRAELGEAMQGREAARKYYLSAIDSLTRKHPVSVHQVDQADWAEVDVPADLMRARGLVERWTQRIG